MHPVSSGWCPEPVPMGSFPALLAAEKVALVPVLGINRYECTPLVPVDATNRDQCSGYIIPHLRARRSHLAICRLAAQDDADADTDAVRLPDFAPAVADDFAAPFLH